MSESESRRVRRYRLRWFLGMMLVVLVVIAAIVSLVLIKHGTIEHSPWTYIALAAAILAAVTGIILTAAEAKFESDAQR